jgi:hypothetical protein
MRVEWENIDTAPRDGTVVLLYGKYQRPPAFPDVIMTGRWSEKWDYWCWVEGCDREDDPRILFEAQLWAPIPQPPGD